MVYPQYIKVIPFDKGIDDPDAIYIPTANIIKINTKKVSYQNTKSKNVAPHNWDCIDSEGTTAELVYRDLDLDYCDEEIDDSKCHDTVSRMYDHPSIDCFTNDPTKSENIKIIRLKNFQEAYENDDASNKIYIKYIYISNETMNILIPGLDCDGDNYNDSSLLAIEINLPQPNERRYMP